MGEIIMMTKKIITKVMAKNTKNTDNSTGNTIKNTEGKNNCYEKKTIITKVIAKKSL